MADIDQKNETALAADGLPAEESPGQLNKVSPGDDGAQSPAEGHQ